MIKIFGHHDRFRIWQVKQLLEDNQIPCFIKNEFAIGAMGELSPLDSLPEVWLTDAEWQGKAKRLINSLESDAHKTQPWRCKTCDEVNEGNFEICWNCSAPEH